jgi:hypothetical protein
MADSDEPAFYVPMIVASARRLRQKSRRATTITARVAEAEAASRVTRIYGETVVGDLPERVLAKVGAKLAWGRVLNEADSLLGWIALMRADLGGDVASTEEFRTALLEPLTQ